MKILHVLPSLDQRYGGPLRAVLDLSARALSSGLKSEILGFGPLHIPDNPFPVERIHNLQLASPARYGYSPDLGPWLRCNLEKFTGVVLHGMWLYPNWAIARECWAQHKPYACFPHGMLDRWSIERQGIPKRIKKTLYWDWRERQVFARACCVFFTTRREKEKSWSRPALPPTQFVLTPYWWNIVDQQPLAPIREAVIQPPPRKVALFLGRVHPKKNLEFLLRAWHDARLGNEWRLVIAGAAESAYRAKLDRIIRNLHLEHRVQFVGFVTGEDKAYLLRRAHWFLLPSKHENFGIAILEAISHGCPVAISDQVDLAESMHEKSEVLPLDRDCWVRFLRERMTDERHRQSLIRADRQFVAPRFNPEYITAQWTATLQHVFATHPPCTSSV